MKFTHWFLYSYRKIMIMKIICTLFCCCVLFVSSYARITPIGPVGAISKEKEDFPFCPVSENTSRQIKEITTILNGKTISEKLATDFKRPRRTASSCGVRILFL